MASKITTLEDLYTDMLKDLYSAEKQLIKALPKMAKAASSEDLATAFQDHLEETKEQVQRLAKIFEGMGEQPGGKRCAGMQGLLKEGEQLIHEMSPSPALDVALIAAAQKVEHYEIAAYGSAAALAGQLELRGDQMLLHDSLLEEKEADAILTDIAKGEVNPDALAA